ncbi:MAG: hypothetical protein IM665_06125 [Phenylobacterium sp.]|nr:hypothetical protein [Phenylobacterium sp.]MCA6254619.1 hypothetical protein [Phenylobacterium sp.]
MTNWIEHNGGPQPVADDVWVEIVWPNPEGRYLSFGDEIEAASEIPWEGNKPRYRILNQHLIDAKQAEIDALRDDLETWQSVFPHVMPERLKSDQQLAEEDVAAKIDAARLEGIRLGLEAADKAIEALVSTGDLHIEEETALEEASIAICTLNSEAIAQEADNALR